MYTCIGNMSTHKNRIDELLDEFDAELRAGFVPSEDICDSCGEAAFIDEGDATVCSHCGSIAGYKIDSTSERRFYSMDENKHGDPTRCGLPTNKLMPESSLGSLIMLRGKVCPELRRVRRFHNYNHMPYRERSLFTVFDQMQSVASEHGIPSAVVDEAKIMYTKASAKCTKRSDNRLALIANCMHMAMKKFKIPRLPHEVAKMFNITPSVMSEGRKHIQEILDITPESTTSSEFMNRFIANLGDQIPAAMRNDITDLCNYVCDRADELGIVAANTAQSLAASSLYFTCKTLGLIDNPSRVADVCLTSTVTINKCYRSLSQHRELLFPEGFLESLEAAAAAT